DDVAQEAFIRAHRNLDRFDARRPFGPWICRIAANLAVNHVRSPEAREDPLPDGHAETPSAAPGPLQGVLDTEARALLDRALGELAAVDAAARELPVPAPPGYFDSRPARVRARLPRPPRRSPPVWVWAAAAGIAIAALAPLLFQQTKAPVPEAAPVQERVPAAPTIAVAPAARPDVPAAGLARDKLAAKDLGPIKSKEAPFEARAAED